MQSTESNSGMNPFKARLLGYLILGLALALGLPPWIEPDLKKEFITRTAVYLSALARTPENTAWVCSSGVPVLHRTEADNYTDLLAAIRALQWQGGQYDQVHFKSADPLNLAQKLNKSKASRICFSYEEGAYLLEVRPPQSILGSTLTQVGANPSQVQLAATLKQSELQRFTFFENYLARLDRQAAAHTKPEKPATDSQSGQGEPKPPSAGNGLEKAIQDLKNLETQFRMQSEQIANYRERIFNTPYYREVLSPVEYEQWQPLLESHMDKTGRAVFKTPSFLIMVSARELSEWVTVQMDGISWARKIAGVLLLIWGLWLMRGIFVKRPGIRINPQGAVLFADTVFVVGMGVLSLGPVDLVMQHWIGLLPLIEEAFQATFSIMYLPCLLFLTYFTSNMGGQSLQVTRQGVVWHGPVSSRALKWEQITGLDLRSDYVMVNRVGLPMPRRLQTRLVFKLGGDDEISLFEPGTKLRKSLILDALGKYIPARLGKDMERVSQKWQ